MPPEMDELLQAAEEAKAEEKRIIQAGIDMEALSASSGWDHLKKWLHLNIEACTQKLIDVDASKLSEVIQLQKAIAAYSNVLGFVQDSIEQGRAFQRPDGSDVDSEDNH